MPADARRRQPGHRLLDGWWMLARLRPIFYGVMPTEGKEARPVMPPALLLALDALVRLGYTDTRAAPPAASTLPPSMR